MENHLNKELTNILKGRKFKDSDDKERFEHIFKVILEGIFYLHLGMNKLMCKMFTSLESTNVLNQVEDIPKDFFITVEKMISEVNQFLENMSFEMNNKSLRDLVFKEVMKDNVLQEYQKDFKNNLKLQLHSTDGGDKKFRVSKQKDVSKRIIKKYTPLIERMYSSNILDSFPIIVWDYLFMTYSAPIEIYVCILTNKRTRINLLMLHHIKNTIGPLEKKIQSTVPIDQKEGKIWAILHENLTYSTRLCICDAHRRIKEEIHEDFKKTMETEFPTFFSKRLPFGKITNIESVISMHFLFLYMHENEKLISEKFSAFCDVLSSVKTFHKILSYRIGMFLDHATKLVYKFDEGANKFYSSNIIRWIMQYCIDISKILEQIQRYIMDGEKLTENYPRDEEMKEFIINKCEHLTKKLDEIRGIQKRIKTDVVGVLMLHTIRVIKFNVGQQDKENVQCTNLIEQENTKIFLRLFPEDSLKMIINSLFTEIYNNESYKNGLEFLKFLGYAIDNIIDVYKSEEIYSQELLAMASLVHTLKTYLGLENQGLIKNIDDKSFKNVIDKFMNFNKK